MESFLRVFCYYRILMMNRSGIMGSFFLFYSHFGSIYVLGTSINIDEFDDSVDGVYRFEYFCN